MPQLRTDPPMHFGRPVVVHEKDAAGTMVVPSLQYVQTAGGLFVPVSPSNPAPMSLSQRSVIQNAGETKVVSNLSVGLAAIPADATGAVITLEGGDIRCWWTGQDPTAAVGNLVVYGDKIELLTRAELLAFKAIRTGATDGTLTVTYYK